MCFNEILFLCFCSLAYEWPKNTGHNCRQWLCFVIRIADFVVTEKAFINLEL